MAPSRSQEQKIPRPPRVLISEAEISRRVDELAAAISADHADADEVLLVGVLRGAFIFLADLARRLTVPVRIDFIALSSYEGTTSGEVRLVLDLRESIRDRHVVVVEDIVDTGNTLSYLKRTLAARQPASLKTCVLTRKHDVADLDLAVDYLGFELPDAWVVGYGLDLADRHRALPYIGVVDPAEEGIDGDGPPVSG
ncbi:MAG TPA: hypoxanthine phosphoribosyltransferase [Thermoanaerobaculia bacterium]|nr:hypoxanthine phosphoribosyltransferase [Thermoanaerobaculia bacterium]